MTTAPPCFALGRASYFISRVPRQRTQRRGAYREAANNYALLNRGYLRGNYERAILRVASGNCPPPSLPHPRFRSERLVTMDCLNFPNFTETCKQACSLFTKAECPLARSTRLSPCVFSRLSPRKNRWHREHSETAGGNERNYVSSIYTQQVYVASASARV